MVRVFFVLSCILSLSIFAKESSFEELMGKNTSSWKYVRTPEDFERIAFFQTHFEKSKSCLNKNSSGKEKIPKILHFIWIGPKAFPEESIERLSRWIQLHPDWIVKFWTDQGRKAPLEGMQTHPVEEYLFQVLGDEFFNAMNFGEKARILALEILLQEGGLYVDHDVLPYRSFDDLHQKLNFYCGLETLGPSILSSSIFPSAHLMAASSEHPVIKEAALWLKKNWILLDVSFPGNSIMEKKNRILHRAFAALSEGALQGLNKEKNRDIVFPSAYFNARRPNPSSYAIHYHDRIWASAPSQFETRVQKQFRDMIKKDNEVVMITLFLAGVSFLGGILLLLYARSVKRGGAIS